MKYLSAPLMVAGLLLACNSSQDVTPATDCLVKASANNGQIIPDEYIVTYRSDFFATTPSNARVGTASEAILAQSHIESKNLETVFVGATEGFVAHLTQTEVETLRQNPAVEAIEPDRIVSLCSCVDVVAPSSVTWSVRKTGYGNGLNFTSKTAWIIDTGIDLDHPDLNVNTTLSRSFITNQTSADDENGHGTHVAGIIGAVNNRIGLLGVASGVKLASLKVLNQLGEGRISNIIAAVAYVNRNGNPGDVVNLSLGGEGTSAALDREIQTAAARGILFAIAAGNEGQPARNFSPARVNHANVFTVSAVDSSDVFAKFSNYGNDVVDVAAYGVRVTSTYAGGRYATLSGTSMAAPHVAGLLLIRGPNLPKRGFAKNDPDGTPDAIARE
jgi:subtilisin